MDGNSAKRTNQASTDQASTDHVRDRQEYRAPSMRSGLAFEHVMTDSSGPCHEISGECAGESRPECE
jgi:hypothetical protein